MTITADQLRELDNGASVADLRERLGEESLETLKTLVKRQGYNLKELDVFAQKCGISWDSMSDGVKKGQRFPRTPGAFAKMCELLGFDPSKAGSVLGGIYAEPELGEALDARLVASSRLLRMHDLYDELRDPIDRQIAEAAIAALWQQLELLADRQG